MERAVREHILRHDSVTAVDENEDFQNARWSQDEAEDPKDAEKESLKASTRVLHAAKHLERILLHNADTSSRSTAQELFRASHVAKTWRTIIQTSSILQHVLWLTPRLDHVPSTAKHDDDDGPVVICFNPILWPIQPIQSTIEVKHRQLNTGSRGPGSWRKMIVASASHSRFAVALDVAGCRAAVVWCKADTTMGTLLDMAGKTVASGRDWRDLDEKEAKEIYETRSCVRQRCDECCDYPAREVATENQQWNSGDSCSLIHGIYK